MKIGAVSVDSTNVHQTVTHGMDFSELSKFAETFAQVAPVLDGISEDEHKQVRETAAEIDVEIAQPQPNVGKLWQLYDVLWR